MVLDFLVELIGGSVEMNQMQRNERTLCLGASPLNNRRGNGLARKVR